MMRYLAVTMAVLSMVGVAQAKRWSMNWNVKNDSGELADNFEVTVEGRELDAVFGPYFNGSPVDPASGELLSELDVFDDPNIGQPQTVGDSTRIDVEWVTLLPGQTGVQSGQTVHYGVSIQGGKNNPGWQLLTPEWTKTVPGGATKRYPAHPTGFTVEQTASALYTIYNNTASLLDITNLQFKVSPTEVPLSQMVPGYKSASLYGFGPMEPMFSLPVGGSRAFPLPMGNTGEFLLAKGVSQVPGLPDTMSEWVQQCEVQFVPEPATLSLLALGSLIALRRRRR